MGQGPGSHRLKPMLMEQRYSVKCLIKTVQGRQHRTLQQRRHLRASSLVYPNHIDLRYTTSPPASAKIDYCLADHADILTKALPKDTCKLRAA